MGEGLGTVEVTEVSCGGWAGKEEVGRESHAMSMLASFTQGEVFCPVDLGYFLDISDERQCDLLDNLGILASQRCSLQ